MNRALEQAGQKIETEGKAELRALGQLVAGSASARAFTIRNMTAQWARFDVRSVPNLVYVVPHEKGARGKGPRKRQRFDNPMMNQVMRPALNANRAEVNRRYEALVARVCNQFNKSVV
jgi:hypothetical protein